MLFVFFFLVTADCCAIVDAIIGDVDAFAGKRLHRGFKGNNAYSWSTTALTACVGFSIPVLDLFRYEVSCRMDDLSLAL
jgi:hypothetical protein